MKIHTDHLTERDVHAATGDLPGVYAEVTTHGSRDYVRALNIKLTGNGRHGNSGSYGAMSPDQPKAATWDEWGVVIARLFAIDPRARFGDQANPIYDGAGDFHYMTGDRFRGGAMPTDAHKAHKWVNVGPYEFECKGRKGHPCSAVLIGA